MLNMTRYQQGQLLHTILNCGGITHTSFCIIAVTLETASSVQTKYICMLTCKSQRYKTTKVNQKSNYNKKRNLSSVFQTLTHTHSQINRKMY